MKEVLDTIIKLIENEHNYGLSVPIFAHNFDVFKTALVFNSDIILNQIEIELGRWQETINSLQHQHKTDVEYLNKEVTSQAWRRVKDNHRLLQLKKSMRKLEPFGGSIKTLHDFEWPANHDLPGLCDQLDSM